MGVITVSVNDGVEREFRRLVEKQHGKICGALGIAMTEAMRLWIKKVKEAGEVN